MSDLHATHAERAARGVVVNDHAAPSALGPLASDDTAAVLAFHRSLPDYQVTPLVAAPTLADRLGVAAVHVKDESRRLGMPSFKILGASWATYRALCHRIGERPSSVPDLPALRAEVADTGWTLVAATDGNHGRAVARMARLLGLHAHILVPADMVPARIDALKGEGATVTVVNGNYDLAVAQSAAIADDDHLVISDTSWEGYEDVPGWVIDGYSTIAAEVNDQLADVGEVAPTVVAAQIGVGAFAASVVRGFAPEGARIVGVEPTKAACLQASARAGAPVHIEGALDSIMAGLNCGTPSPIAWPTLHRGICAFTTVEDTDAEQAMRALAQVGVESGESGAAGLAGLMAFSKELGLSGSDRVLVISTEGATDPVAYRRIVGR